MALVSFQDMMQEAESGRYAVGYFESWNLESLLAVADAAANLRSPVILGFSGIYLPATESGHPERLATYAALGNELCRQLPVPACLLFNESPYLDWVLQAVEARFGLVMFTDENLELADQQEKVRQVVRKAHAAGVAVEGELLSLPGVSGQLAAVPEDLRLTDPQLAKSFVEFTGVDALAVNIGQAHVHGRRQLPLNLSRLAELRRAVPVPLVLHGATSVERESLRQAVGLGIRKVNVGSILKRAFFETLRNSSRDVAADYSPYDVVGSGHPSDILASGREAIREAVEELMKLFGSAGKA
ncbi:MAG: class II fructose-bisphosphate aldolase [Terriglobia bacterium]